MKPENKHAVQQASERNPGMVAEQPLQDDLPSILAVIRTGWVDAYQNVPLGITGKDLAREHDHRFEGAAGQSWGAQIIDPPPDIVSMVARNADGEVVGFCRAKEQDKANVITGLYVLPAVRGTGIGTMLMNNVLEKLNRLKPTILHVATYNSKAIAFYRKLGFEPAKLCEDFQMEYSDKKIPIMEMQRDPFAP